MAESKDQESKENGRLPLFRLEPWRSIYYGSEVFSVRFSPDGQHLAAGGGDGSIKIFNSSTGKSEHEVEGGSTASTPTTCIRFRPNTSAHRVKDVFLTANACGIVRHWQLHSSTCLHTYSDKAEQVYALDYNDMGTKFVTAGSDGKLRIYDEDSMSLSMLLEGGLSGDYERESAGHSNRVFSVKFTHDEHILLSGGWDNTVQIWDTREGCPVRSLSGPHVCGDSLDIRHGKILTGSWRPTNQLELWDFGSGERIQEIPWNSNDEKDEKPCLLYAAQFSKDSIGKFILAGGSGKNEAKVFDHLSDNTLIGTVSDFSDGVFAVDFSSDGDMFAVAGGDGYARLIKVGKNREYYK